MPQEEYSGCSISPQRCGCFDKLSDEEMKYLNNSSVKVEYKKGEVICKQGSFTHSVFFMERGLAKVIIQNGSNSLVLRIVPGGSLFGLSPLNEDNAFYFYSTIAYVDSEVTQIDLHAFRKLVHQNSRFAKEVIDILSANSIQIYSRFFCFTHKQSYGRLADVLLCLSDRVFMTSRMELPLTRKELAELSGMSPETIARMLSKFNDDGIIRIDGKAIELLDAEKLRKISETG